MKDIASRVGARVDELMGSDIEKAMGAGMPRRSAPVRSGPYVRVEHDGADDFQLDIPKNKVIPHYGSFSRKQTVDLLRQHHKNPKAVHFIADMMEE